MSALKRIRLFEQEELSGNPDPQLVSLKRDPYVEIMRMVFLDHYFLFLARKKFQGDDERSDEFLYLTKNMVVHNPSNPFVIHHESLFIKKVVNSKHKLLFTMGRDRTFNENMQVAEEANFIKIWDFMSLVEGTLPGCKLRSDSL